MVFVWLSLTSLRMIISGSIHVAVNGMIIFFFFYDWIINCIYLQFFIHSCVSGHLGYFHALTIVKSTCNYKAITVLVSRGKGWVRIGR